MGQKLDRQKKSYYHAGVYGKPLEIGYLVWLHCPCSCAQRTIQETPPATHGKADAYWIIKKLSTSIFRIVHKLEETTCGKKIEKAPLIVIDRTVLFKKLKQIYFCAFQKVS